MKQRYNDLQSRSQPNFLAKTMKVLEDERQQNKTVDSNSKPVPLYQDMFKKKRIAKQSILRKISHLLPAKLLDKTAVCKHEHGCFENIVRKALWTFIVGYIISILLKNAGLLLASPR